MAFSPVAGPQGPAPFAPPQPPAPFPGAGLQGPIPGGIPGGGGAPDLGALLGGPQGPQDPQPQPAPFPGAAGPQGAPAFGCGSKLDANA